jgi:DNA ligase (NAD+)
MDKQQAKKRIEQISQELEEHNYRYYVLDQPTVSDKEYDELMRELIGLEGDFPELKDANSPTQRVGTKISSSLPTVAHKAKMYSLDNTYTLDEIKAWHERLIKNAPEAKLDFMAELKIDGVSIALTYENGKLVLGATRGDGETGLISTETQNRPLYIIRERMG